MVLNSCYDARIAMPRLFTLKKRFKHKRFLRFDSQAMHYAAIFRALLGCSLAFAMTLSLKSEVQNVGENNKSINQRLPS